MRRRSAVTTGGRTGTGQGVRRGRERWRLQHRAKGFGSGSRRCRGGGRRSRGRVAWRSPAQGQHSGARMFLTGRIWGGCHRHRGGGQRLRGQAAWRSQTRRHQNGAAQSFFSSSPLTMLGGGEGPHSVDCEMAPSVVGYGATPAWWSSGAVLASMAAQRGVEFYTSAAWGGRMRRRHRWSVSRRRNGAGVDGGCGRVGER